MGVSVFAPATVANLACGFDILGLAVDAPGDVIHAQIADNAGVVITSISGDAGKLPLDAEKNTAGMAVIKMLEYLQKQDIGINIQIEKRMPLGSGLGSSAASAVAAVVAANELLGKPLTKKELLPFAMEGERIACGTAHADNAAPSLLGGIVLVRSYAPLDVVELQVPEQLWVSVIHPQIEVATRDSRAILRPSISMKEAIIQWGNVGGLVAGFLQNDYELIGRSLHDEVAEPLRSLLIAGFDSVKQAALNAHALGSSISGSGPSVFALCKGEETARMAAEAMQKAFYAIHIENEVYVSKVNTKGAILL